MMNFEERVGGGRGFFKGSIFSLSWKYRGKPWKTPLRIARVDEMWVPVTTAWRVLRLREEDTAYRCGG
jgi:hypothetical protein